MKSNYLASPFWAFGVVAALAGPALADNVLTTHRLSAGLAAEAVAEAVAVCAKQGYKVTAAIVDTDGVVQALLRGDDASMVAFATASDKAFTVLMLGAARNEDSSGAIAERIGNAPAGGLAKVQHVLLQPGALRIKVGNEAIAAIGVGGAPGGNFDEACAKAGLDKISDRLK
ncbi:MAG: heme-binding protein [Pseudolabrys sp.]